MFNICVNYEVQVAMNMNNSRIKMMCNIQWMNNQYGYILMGGRRLCLVDLGMNIVCSVVVHMVEWLLVQSYRLYVVNYRGTLE